MELNIKEEIIASYEKLIKDCETQIEMSIEVDKNSSLINEYNNVLNEVKLKSEDAYDGVLKEMEQSSRGILQKGREFGLVRV